MKQDNASFKPVSVPYSKTEAKFFLSHQAFLKNIYGSGRKIHISLAGIGSLPILSLFPAYSVPPCVFSVISSRATFQAVYFFHPSSVSKKSRMSARKHMPKASKSCFGLFLLLVAIGQHSILLSDFSIMPPLHRHLWVIVRSILFCVFFRFRSFFSVRFSWPSPPPITPRSAARYRPTPSTSRQ